MDKETITIKQWPGTWEVIKRIGHNVVGSCLYMGAAAGGMASSFPHDGYGAVQPLRDVVESIPTAEEPLAEK